MAASKMAPSSGCAARYSQALIPWREGKAGSPVAMLSRRDDQVDQAYGRPIMVAQVRTDPGTSDRRYSASGVKPKRPLASTKIPTLASARSRRYKDGARPPSSGSKLLDAPGAVLQLVGDPEPCGDVDRLRYLVGVGHPPQRIPRRRLAHGHADLPLVNYSRRAYPAPPTVSIGRPTSERLRRPNRELAGPMLRLSLIGG
jgi:hypothetical protein